MGYLIGRSKHFDFKWNGAWVAEKKHFRFCKLYIGIGKEYINCLSCKGPHSLGWFILDHCEVLTFQAGIYNLSICYREYWQKYWTWKNKREKK